jgi:hypothetical protein
MKERRSGWSSALAWAIQVSSCSPCRPVRILANSVTCAVRASRCGQWARTLVRLACSDSSREAGSRRIQLVMWRTLGGAGTAGGAAWPWKGRR